MSFAPTHSRVYSKIKYSYVKYITRCVLLLGQALVYVHTLLYTSHRCNLLYFGFVFNDLFINNYKTASHTCRVDKINSLFLVRSSDENRIRYLIDIIFYAILLITMIKINTKILISATTSHLQKLW